jgi:hypothetical protein
MFAEGGSQGPPFSIPSTVTCLKRVYQELTQRESQASIRLCGAELPLTFDGSSPEYHPTISANKTNAVAPPVLTPADIKKLEAATGAATD